MTVAPVAGVPPASTLAQFDKSFQNFPPPTYIAPGLTKHNFYKANGMIILAAMVALLMIILLFLDVSFSPLSGIFYQPPTFT